MKKFLLVTITTLSIFTTQTNMPQVRKCEDAPIELTKEELEACIRMQAFARAASIMHKRNPSKANGLSQLTTAQWNTTLQKHELSPEAIKHIEAMMWESGLKDTWGSSHSFSHAIHNIFLTAIFPKIFNYGFTSYATYQTAKVVITKLKPDSEGNTNNTTFFNIMYSQVENLSNTNTGLLVTGVIIGLTVIGGNIYCQVYEELPLHNFSNQEEVDEYINSIQSPL